MPTTEYTDYKKEPISPITFADFPRRLLGWSAESVRYFVKHHIDVKALNSVNTVYPSEKGICFVMTGKVCFQERITAKKYLGLMRFYSPPGSPLGEVLYFPAIESHEQYKPLFVVEGLTDALVIHQSGYSSCALIGAKVSARQLAMLQELSGTRDLYVIPDNDKAGEECNATLQRALSIRVRHLPTQYKDVCDMPTDDRHRFLKGAIK